MSGISNGIFLHGATDHLQVRLIFSEYAKNALLEWSALMKLPIVYIFTHDSIGLGEDGPTHQAVEQLSSLRLVPDLDVWRPADTQETAAGWIAALTSTERPLAFALSRQTLHEIPKTKSQIKNISKGGYVVCGSSGRSRCNCYCYRLEVSLAVDAADLPEEKDLKY